MNARKVTSSTLREQLTGKLCSFCDKDAFCTSMSEDFRVHACYDHGRYLTGALLIIEAYLGVCPPPRVR